MRMVLAFAAGCAATALVLALFSPLLRRSAASTPPAAGAANARAAPIAAAADSAAPPVSDHAAAAGGRLAGARGNAVAGTPPATTAADGGVAAAGATASPALPAVTSDDWTRGKFAHFSDDELREMARRCELRWQLPPFTSAPAPALGDAYERALGAERDRYRAGLAALYTELTGDTAGAAALDIGALGDALRRNIDARPTEVARRLAEARAGGPAAGDGSIYERFLQLQLGAGEAFERALAPSLGKERARELAGAAGPRFTLTGCDPDSALFRSTRQ